MTEEIYSLVKKSIELFDRIYTSIRKPQEDEKKVSNLESSLRARSREMPSLIQEIGLIGALSYCFSKGNEYYAEIIKIIEDKSNKDKIKEYAEKTNAGYSIYLYILLKAINHTKILQVEVDKPYEAIKQLSQNLNKTRIIERMIMPYLLQIKRLCEGTLRKGVEYESR
jgi:CRISPR-associated protein (Cas_Cmr5).